MEIVKSVELCSLFRRMSAAAIILLVGLLSIPGCGGGSAGTGTGDNSIRILGTMVDPSGSPISQAIVTVIETGDSDETDADGHFDITTQPVAPNLTLSVEANGDSATTTITAPGENGTISITIKFNPMVDEITTEDLSVEVKIVGLCDSYFENRMTIRQANSAPLGVSCTVKDTVSANGMKLAHVPIAIQFRACPRRSPWLTSALGETMTGSNIGVGQIQFKFFNDEEHCVYRIVTPFDEIHTEPLITEIHTFTYQAFLERNDH